MWILDCKESWVLKNWCFWSVVLEKTFESPLDSKEIQPVHPKGNQPWIFIGRTDVEAETPILWTAHVKNWLIGKDPDAGKDWRKEEKGMTEDEMVLWHHRLNGHEFEQAPGVGDGQGSLACCSPWCRQESDRTEGLNWTESVHCNLEGNGWMNKCSLFLSVLLPVPLIGWCLTESGVQGSLLYSPYSVFKNWRRIESRSGEKLKISKIYSHLFKFSLLHLNKQLSYRKYLHSLCLIYS